MEYVYSSRFADQEAEVGVWGHPLHHTGGLSQTQALGGLRWPGGDSASARSQIQVSAHMLHLLALNVRAC